MSGKKAKPSRKQKHVPMRTCIICREKMDKRQLVRIVNNAEEGIIIDSSGKKAGRGAYLCRKAACWHKMSTTPILDNALKTAINADHKSALLTEYNETLKVVSHA